MKKMNLLAIAVATSLTAGAATAATIDFRHEWRTNVDYVNNNGDKKHKDLRQASRVKLGDSWKYDDKTKFKAGIEVKFRSDNDESKFMEDLHIYETELDLGMSYSIDKNWYLELGMPIAHAFDEPYDNDGDNQLKKVTYKPQFRVGYKATNGLTTSLRYRHEFADFRQHTRFADKDMETSERLANPQKSRITLAGSYKVKDLPKLYLAYEANYIKSLDNVMLYDGEDYEWDFGIKGGYKFGSWMPFAEIWTVDVDSNADEREMKYRLGIKYSF